MSLEGQQVGRYRFERLLGRGGMDEVCHATDPLIKRLETLEDTLSALPSRRAC